MNTMGIAAMRAMAGDAFLIPQSRIRSAGVEEGEIMEKIKIKAKLVMYAMPGTIANLTTMPHTVFIISGIRVRVEWR